ncbi:MULTISPECIES: hypothetical protein [unclassified Lactococcus]|uniref:hypothetical protein n=1 Tax=unclassified Lactococcus TaxID=2643510 RepID=UPI0011C717BD|nr:MULTISPECIES: hypothetical protein [unclassified Lactococcus]MQW23037.1 hypothetical protein [Lactococcus sp. dk101]TXK44382.1 hypothetical protein FVP42_05380 [Lactococcus sp. dk310]TXK50192.1 hypothetical protein FVP43_05350 [Lactococcus sp. dk322]
MKNTSDGRAKFGFSKIRNFFKKYLLIGILALVLILVGPLLLKQWMSVMIDTFNPFHDQQVAVAKHNRSNDAFSAIQGTSVDSIPLNGIEKMFNWTSKSKDELIISIPKVNNTSSLFSDDAYSKELKEAWINSINSDELEKEAKNYQIDYNGSPVKTYNDGVTTTYGDITKNQENDLTSKFSKYLHNNTKLEFGSWEKVDKTPNVEFTRNKDKSITVKGISL